MGVAIRDLSHFPLISQVLADWHSGTRFATNLSSVFPLHSIHGKKANYRMSVRTRTELNGKIGIIEVKGSLVGDSETDQFREAVTDFVEQGNRSLIIDLQKLNYMNSSGLGALISTFTTYTKNGGKVALAGISNNIQNLLIMTKLIDIFDVYDTVDEAIDTMLKIKSS